MKKLYFLVPLSFNPPTGGVSVSSHTPMWFQLQCQAFTTFCTTAIDDASTGFGRHSRTEAVISCSFNSARLKCSLHFPFPLYLKYLMRVSVTQGCCICPICVRGIIVQPTNIITPVNYCQHPIISVAVVLSIVSALPQYYKHLNRFGYIIGHSVVKAFYLLNVSNRSNSSI
jgi:hypothetical protein